MNLLLALGVLSPHVASSTPAFAPERTTSNSKPAAFAQDPPAPAAPSARELFLKNCAQCHGETGDGNGVQKLDKPARSFKDGGFSYGNTPEALLRTITFGIPGTPMPSFASALSETQRKELAAYVITLGPEVVKVDASETRLVVKDAPLFVRGKLPPIVDGAKETVRGLLVGTPDGFTFEYDVEDVRLLGVRQGDFVERRDWGGRGGDALLPLGKLVLRTDAPSIVAAFAWNPPVESSHSVGVARSRFLGSRLEGSVPHLTYRIEQDGTWRDERDRKAPPQRIALAVDADESICAIANPLGTGFRREVDLELAAESATADGELEWTVLQVPQLEKVAGDIRWAVVRLQDGRHLIVNLSRADGRGIGVGMTNVVVPEIPVVRGKRQHVVVDMYLLSEWSPEIRAAWTKELAR
ncbi:MAG: c-type cytochrome [Planctomycetes bacterium]|nr:c-type cytochrome [Planctomycetota bacterium]